ncbi:MAG: TFIIB-type zinc ribbon-containing protein [Ignavibacteria bacterium]
MTENKNITEFNKEIEKAFQAAWHSEKGGDDAWNQFLSLYGIEAISSQDKQSLLNSEMKIAKGAFPIELRRIYEKIFEKYSTKGDPQLNDALNNFDMESKIKDYYQKIKPFSGMSDIFGNASSSLHKYSAGMKKEKHSTMKCKNCGAPRLEEMQYDVCLFCGSKLFENNI